MSHSDVAQRTFIDFSRHTEGLANQIQINLNVMRTAYSKIAKTEFTNNAVVIVQGLAAVIERMRFEAVDAEENILRSANAALSTAHENLELLRDRLQTIGDNHLLMQSMSRLEIFLKVYNESFAELNAAFKKGTELLQSLQFVPSQNTFFAPNKVKYIKKINVKQEEFAKIRNCTTYDQDSRVQTINNQLNILNSILSQFFVFEILQEGTPLTSTKLQKMQKEQETIALAAKNMERQLIYGTKLLKNTGSTIRNHLNVLKDERDEDDTETEQAVALCILATDAVIEFFGNILRQRFQAIVNFASNLPLTEIISELTQLFRAGQRVTDFYIAYKKHMVELMGITEELIIHEAEASSGGSSAQSSLRAPEETDFSIEKLYGLVLSSNLSTKDVFTRFCVTHEYHPFLGLSMETPGPIHFKNTSLFDYQILLPLSLATTNALREGSDDSRSLCIVAEAGMGKSYMMYYTMGCLNSTMEQDWTFVFCDNNVVKLYEECINYFVLTQQITQQDARNKIRCFDSPAAMRFDLNRISRPQISNLKLQSDLDRFSSLAQEKVRLQRAFLMNLSEDRNKSILRNYLGQYSAQAKTCQVFNELLLTRDPFTALFTFYRTNTINFDWNARQPQKWFVWIIDTCIDQARGRPVILSKIGKFLADKISENELLNFSQWCDTHLIPIPEYSAVMTECETLKTQIRDSPGLDTVIPGASQVFGVARNDIDLAAQLNYQACMTLSDLRIALRQMNTNINGMKVVFCSYDSNALPVYFDFIQDLSDSNRRFNLILDEVDRIYSGANASTNQFELEKWARFKALMNAPAVKNMLGLTATTDFNLRPEFSLITALPNEMESLPIDEVYQLYSEYYKIPIPLKRPYNCENFSTDAGAMESVMAGSFNESTILEMCLKHLIKNIDNFGRESSILAFVHGLAHIDYVIKDILPTFLDLGAQISLPGDPDTTVEFITLTDELPSESHDPDAQFVETVCYSVTMRVSRGERRTDYPFHLAVLRGSNDAAKLKTVMPILQNIATDADGNEYRKQPFIPCICMVSAEKFDRGHDFFNFRSLIKFGDVSGPPPNQNWAQVKQINGRIRRVKSQKFFETQGVGFFWYHPEEKDSSSYQYILNYIKEFEETKTHFSKSNEIVYVMMILMLGAQSSRLLQLIASADASSTPIVTTSVQSDGNVVMGGTRAEQSLFSELSVKLLQFYAF